MNPEWPELVHRLKNQVAGMLTNLELVELLVETPASDEQRAQLTTALGFTRASAIHIADVVKTLETFER